MASPSPFRPNFGTSTANDWRTAATPRSRKSDAERRRETRACSRTPCAPSPTARPRFYRLIPKMVLKVRRAGNPVSAQTSEEAPPPVTFRAAGTSLSGQAIRTPYCLLSHTGKNWRRHAVADEGKTIRRARPHRW